MYEMHAEVLPGPEGCLRWHAVRPGGARTAVCGCPVGTFDPDLPDEPGIGELCSGCMTEIASAMECAGTA
ncbi:hypothetical protein [Kitasatospora sp. KL5]|uniref:hypothetical protein n=1 Tax=Kitasatospora sp. KL5 TaxID=3425125 RepID=UPI003D6F1598